MEGSLDEVGSKCSQHSPFPFQPSGWPWSTIVGYGWRGPPCADQGVPTMMCRSMPSASSREELGRSQLLGLLSLSMSLQDTRVPSFIYVYKTKQQPGLIFFLKKMKTICLYIPSKYFHPQGNFFCNAFSKRLLHCNVCIQDIYSYSKASTKL